MKKLVCLVLFLLGGCTVHPPSTPNDLCGILEEKDGWFSALVDVEQRWGVPMHVSMAVMYQESSFISDAQPGVDYVLGFIPWGRISSAYGYAQAKDEVWSEYLANAGARGDQRDDFEAAVDFMGYYMHHTWKINNVSKYDAKNQYLCYHDGWGGCKRRTYKKKQWLMDVAKKVGVRSDRYKRQLSSCRSDLESEWFSFFSFG